MTEAAVGISSASNISINWELGKPWTCAGLNELYAIFSSTQPTGSDQYLWGLALLGLLEDGRMTARAHVIPRLRPNLIEADQYSDGRRESYEHKALKYSAVAWLESLGFREVAPEARLSFDLAVTDLYSPEHGGVVVECGNTKLERLQHLGRGIGTFVLVPYPEPQQDTLEVYIFRKWVSPLGSPFAKPQQDKP